MSGESLAQLLFEHPAPHDEVLAYDNCTQLTGAQMRRAADDLASELQAAGVRPGDPVVLQVPNSVDAVVAMIAIWRAQAVFVPLNHRSPAAEREHVLKSVPAVAIVDGNGVAPLGGTPQHFDPEIAFVTWTSGTTGPPKAILHTHDGYFELLDRVLKNLKPTNGNPAQAGPPNLVPVPLALNSGIYNVLFGLRAGRALVIMDRFSTAEFADVVYRFGITSTVLPPAAIAMLTEDAAISNLKPLKFVRSITAPLPPPVARSFYERFGVFVLNGYGQAEIGEVIGWTGADARNHPEKVGAAGRPHPGVHIKIVDAGRGEVPAGEVGQLIVRPPKLAAGFASGEGLGERIDSEGFVATGDLARIDEDGFVWITGRMGEVIVRGGNKVYPGEVEDILCLSPAVAEAAVIAAPDDRLGEVPVAFIVNAADASPASDADLTALCRDSLVSYKVPTAFHRVTELPRNDIGKIRRAELTKRLAGLQ
ncbi:class I adenylate-forming enzyme family protein [Mycobacterium sp. 94-17]|uniref:class I adenylate-forming enzyme family protein n=1 Tax=Mycobacterium sp. 94-17 TaxID=2986147 RepID=UPI002D1E57D2|nr:class I adenylate-forming enzyme family protein [Mycobacterium sp. 94-17]MEB4209745.1 class I adenylate-forming enzyme family protein [Mycobacterium sp. 94-17]